MNRIQWPFDEQELVTRTFSLLEEYLHDFQEPSTGVLYGARLSTKERWTSPEEVRARKPAPWGYGSHIEDTVLHCGHLLVALLEAHRARPDDFLEANIRKLFKALQFIGSLCPVPGIVPRGPHPDDPGAFYDDSSMDQNTTFVISLARYANSKLATDEDKVWIREKLNHIGERLEKFGWSLRRADGVTQAHVGFAWTGFNSQHASILLPTVLALHEGTGNPHWAEVFEKFSKEKDGQRWKEFEPGPHVKISAHPIYANQLSFRLDALYEFEESPVRRRSIRDLLAYAARLQWKRRFPGQLLRKFYSEKVWKEASQAFGWGDDYLGGCDAALRLFRPSFVSHRNPMAVLAHLRFPLGSLYMILLSRDRGLIQQHAEQIWRLLTSVDLSKIPAGETNYLFSAVALHLYAACYRQQEPGASEAGEEMAPYGRKLPMLKSLGVGPSMDVAVEGKWACIIGKGKLQVADVSSPGNPRVMGSLSGLGNVRQVGIRHGIAYVTAREDGLWVVDVGRAEKPRLLFHYDTIEFATGVALSGNLLFVACRNYGVEIIDVTVPARPTHLSIVRTGEAQSVVVRNGFLYAGVWGSSEVVTVDVHDPRRPKITARAPLDGYGDGVDVAGKYLYVATGHHSRRPHRREGDPGFGRGHGLEIFDLADPSRPVFVSRIKTPGLYQLGMDMWSVTVAGPYAFLADTYNGVFVIDVSAPAKPSFVAHRQLPTIKSRNSPSPVGGLAVLEDTLYAAGAWSDLHVLSAEGLAALPENQPDEAPTIPRSWKERQEGVRIYRPDGQVHAVDFIGSTALIACGSAGLHTVRLWPEVECVAETSTAGFAVDVRVQGQRAYVAEGAGGLSIWKVSEAGAPKLLGRYRPRGQTVRQVVVPRPGRYALLQVAAYFLHVVDVSDPGAPKLVLKDKRLGLLYRDQIMDGLAEDRYACAFWHVSGLYWYDLYGGPVPKYSGDHFPHRIGSPNGLAARGRKTLAICRGGYALLDRGESRPLDELEIHHAGSYRLEGKPTIFEEHLYVAHRPSGKVAVLDISEPTRPKLLKTWTTAGNPGRVVEKNDAAIIPDGYGGLLVERAY